MTDPTAEPDGGSDGRNGTGSGTGASSAAEATASPSVQDYSPMMATSGSAADLQGSDWQFELKWDGVRAVIVADDEDSPHHQPQRQRRHRNLPGADGPHLLAGGAVRGRR